MSRPSAASYVKHRRKIARRRGFLIPDRPVSDATPVAPHVREDRGNFRYGRDLEHRAVEAFASGDFPPWYRGVRPATEKEDKEGVDLWVFTTDPPPVAVQIKSSAARAALFRARHPGMECATVVLHARMTDEQIRERVLEGVGRVMWARGVRKRAA